MALLPKQTTMKLVRGLHNLAQASQPSALTIGNFDGVHRGHQAIIRQLTEAARKRNLCSRLMSFEPLPREYFMGDQAPPRLSSLREKWCALHNHGLDEFICVKFDHRLAELSPQAFIDEILLQRLKVKYLVIGDDFRFGRNREGDYALLQAAGKTAGFEVHPFETVLCHNNERISSTRIREAMQANQLELANTLLGYDYQICGRVAHGDKRGRTIGFPTTNIRLHRHATPLSGVYAVTMTGVDEEPITGVANIGKRPTVDGQHLQLEVHLFNFHKEIYNAHVCVQFKHKLRDEQRFESFDALKQQIQVDAQQARDYFAQHKTV